MGKCSCTRGLLPELPQRSGDNLKSVRNSQTPLSLDFFLGSFLMPLCSVRPQLVACLEGEAVSHLFQGRERRLWRWYSPEDELLSHRLGKEAVHSTRNITWDLSNPFSFPLVSDQPFPLSKQLEYIHITGELKLSRLSG